MKKVYLFLFLLIICYSGVKGQKIIEIDTKTQGFTRYSGYFNFYWDEKTGRVLLEIDKFIPWFRWWPDDRHSFGFN